MLPIELKQIPIKIIKTYQIIRQKIQKRRYKNKFNNIKKRNKVVKIQVIDKNKSKIYKMNNRLNQIKHLLFKNISITHYYLGIKNLT